ncbi:MAG: Hpt domain-containing protein [Rubrivivax sp.]|nr:Hpt domain-containing protein [Rubrivivax sp.]
MMQADAPHADTAGAGEDLSALAWVQGELRLTLEKAHKSLRRYVKEAESIGGSDVDVVDPGVLRTARVQLHQGVGALELVGLPVAAKVLRAGEAAVQRLTSKPKLATLAAVETIERGSFAVLDYIGRVLAGKAVPPLALYPQYAAVQALAGAERVHPADLWAQDWQWRSLPAEPGVPERATDELARGEMEYLALALMRQPDPAVQQRMSDLCAELGASAQRDGQAEQATLWRLAAAFFESQAAGLVKPDLHTKRIASRLLSVLRAALRGAADAPDRLAQDLLFYCVRADLPPDASAVPRLAALQQVWPGDKAARADYDTPRLGLFDPAQIQQARRRVAAAKDAWSAVAGGDMQRAAGLQESFALLADSVQKLFPGGDTLAPALQAAAAPSAKGERAPAAPLAMEVATSVLYLDAVLDDGDLDQPQLAERLRRLAQRVADVAEGADPQPLESWMEELYRRTSDRQTIGSVVQELRSSLSDIEKQIDQYFRDPTQRGLLIQVPGQLQSIRSVLSVLGMDQASQAVLRMRDDVDALVETEADPQQAARAGTFDRLADNLGALSFLIDMISVQPQMAKSLFRFDPDTGCLSAVMGQSERDSSFAELAAEAPEAAPKAAPAQEPVKAPAAAPALAADDGLEDDAEMREVFLEEAREVIAAARESLVTLADRPDEVAEITAVRRAFHTLKGSSRMVGLKDFGEAAWACEQLYNARLAHQARMDAPLQTLSAEALDYLGQWADAIADGRTDSHRPEAVALAADSLRLEGRLLPIPMPQQGAPADVPADLPASAEPVAHASEDEAPTLADVMPEAAAASAPEEAPGAAAREGDDETEPHEPSEHPTFLPTMPALQDMVPELPSAEDLSFPTLDLRAEAEPRPEEAARDERVRFELDLGEQDETPAEDISLPELGPVLEDAEPDMQAEADLAGADEASPPEPEVKELSLDDLGLDFGPASPEAPALLESEAEAEAEAETDADAEAEAEPGAGVEGAREPDAEEPEPEAALPAAAETAIEPGDAHPADEEPEVSEQEEEPVKIVGPLRVPIPLFNIFLNEADEQSRRLATELAEWAMESHRPVSEAAIALAHSLAGNSATVGFAGLSALARALEHGLMRSRAQGPGTLGEPALFSDTAEEIRRLLHQFAAGFLHPVPPALMDRLAEHEHAAAIEARDTDPGALDVDDEQQTLPPAPAPALPPRVDIAGDADLDAVDQIDRDLFPIFEEEADELLPQLRSRLADWVRHPSDPAAAAACMRTLHTFKGGARLAGAMRVGEMAHRLETEVEQLAGHGEPTVEQVEHLLGRADAMANAFELLRKPATAAAAAMPEAAAVPPDSVPVPAVEVPPAEAAKPAAGPAAVPPVAIDWSRFATDVPEAAADTGADTAVPGANASVRVRATLLDRLVNHAGEVSITRARIESDMRGMQAALADLTDNLDRLRSQLRDIELQAETQISSRMEAAKAAAQSFDPLEMDRFTRFQEITRMMAESVNDVATVQRGLQRTLQSSEDELAMQARLTRELQDDLLRTRMVEFESLSDRLHRVVRQAAKDTDKSVRLELMGGAIEIDRGVLERMVGPFEHLLRNCVAHGIETADVRRSAGKKATGQISVTALQEGNEVAVEFRDDGAGLNLPRIRERAVARGLLDAAARPSDEELAQLIFVPGFSTSDAVSDVAGRGVGMDVVRAEVTAMGGRIETRSEAGRGTTFRLLLPLTTAVTQVVMMRFGSRQVAVPSTLVEIVRRAKPADVENSYAAGAYTHDGAELPFYWLGALLQDEGRGPTSTRAQTVVVMRSAAQRVALHVDEVIGNQEVVVKNLGPQLARLPGLAGITLLPSGAVATIYNPVALAHVYGDEARARMQPREEPARPAQHVDPAAEAPLPPLVMVVDDSVTVRRVTQRMLTREGYRVVLAKDGLEAIEKLAGERPAVLLSDIEMPRMDGFDLVRNVRADARLAGLPVIMITSRIAQKHRDYAAELGVDHYLGKPYSEDELLALVARHAGADIEV